MSKSKFPLTGKFRSDGEKAVAEARDWFRTNKDRMSKSQRVFGLQLISSLLMLLHAESEEEAAHASGTYHMTSMAIFSGVDKLVETVISDIARSERPNTEPGEN